jgi:hypothetical protein
LLQPCFSTNFHTSPLPFYQNIFIAKNFHQSALRKKNLNNASHIYLTAIAINYHDGNSGYNPLLPRAFSVEIPSWMGF